MLKVALMVSILPISWPRLTSAPGSTVSRKATSPLAFCWKSVSPTVATFPWISAQNSSWLYR